MKGSLTVVKGFGKQRNKTNFDDWSDPNCKCSEKAQFEKKSKVKLTENESKLQSFDFHTKKESQSSETSVFIENLRKKIREGYPLLSWKEIRNFKLPFYKSLIENLKDDGFTGTSNFLESLVAIDDQWHELFGNKKDTTFLKSNKSGLKLLCEKLTVAEVARLEKNIATELRSMLELARFFTKSNNRSWQWLAEEFFEQSIAISEENELVGSEVELDAIGKHLYAEFSLKVLNDTARAKGLIEQSMELSKEQSWRSKSLTGEESDVLYLDSCLLLHRIFLVMSENMKYIDISSAIKFCKSSLFWARQVGSKEAERAALLNLAILCLEAKDFAMTWEYIELYMDICASLNDVLGFCEGFILRANYYEDTNDIVSLITTLEELLKLAEDSSIVKMMAIAHRRLATTYFMIGSEKKLQLHALKAYNYYVSLDAKVEIEETRCLTGIGQAQEIMPQYLDLLLEAEEANSGEFETLMLWKNWRIPFFTDVKLFQPEGEINKDISDRMEAMKSEEWASNYKARQVTSASISMSYFTPKIASKKGSAVDTMRPTLMSKSVMNFKVQMRRAKDSETSSITSVSHF